MARSIHEVAEALRESLLRQALAHGVEMSPEQASAIANNLAMVVHEEPEEARREVVRALTVMSEAEASRVARQRNPAVAWWFSQRRSSAGRLYTCNLCDEAMVEERGAPTLRVLRALIDHGVSHGIRIYGGKQP